ncbi:hypothetical protein GOBAR_AA30554 [Gossypium barbadense]|uniref:Myb/SANT-like domain-containing protein n=1 Tax=Gossypium barbadense TaxID=3634 RepID=A0A2P5WGC3_GOSBA|nr:hypothetical protein GOBAR_AA30554 [Gossypium barbadense]
MVKTRKFVKGDSTLATKAVWDDELTLIFCELCVNEVNVGNRPTTHLNSKGWENVVAFFQAKTQKNYGKPQLKNKWDTLKKEWRLWRELLKESTGIGWCPSKKTVDTTEEWCDEKIQVTTGENAWAPSKKSSSSRKSSRNSLATHIEKLCESMASPRKSVNEIIFPHSQYTISNIMDALRDLGDEIPKKDELYYFAIKMVWWLRREYVEQNPIASFSSLVTTSLFPFQPYHPPPPP